MKINLGKYSFNNLVQKRVRAQGSKNHPILKFISKFIPEFIKNIFPSISFTPNVRKKIQLIFAMVQVVAIYAIVMLIIIFSIKVVASINIRDPNNAKDVLKSVNTPYSTFYTTQIYRVKKIDDYELKRGTLMQALLDTRGSGKYQFTAQGVGHYKNEASPVLLLQTDGERQYIKIGNGGLLSFVPQDGVSFPPINELIPVSAKDLISLDPKLVSDKQNVAGVRGWKISFIPSKEIILQMFLYNFLSNIINLDDNGDFKKIENGNFKVISGNAYITRSSRELVYLDVIILVDGAKYRLFTQYRLNNNNRIKNMNLNDPKSIKTDPFPGSGSLDVIKTPERENK